MAAVEARADQGGLVGGGLDVTAGSDDATP
jgi:hypothetical protein